MHISSFSFFSSAHFLPYAATATDATIARVLRVESPLVPGFKSHARGLLEALGWHKGMGFKIDKNPDGSVTVRKA